MWDKELNSESLKAAIRKIDHTLSDQFAQNLFETLKNRDGLIEIPVLLSDLTGLDTQTTDFKAKMFKSLYGVIYQNRKDQ